MVSNSVPPQSCQSRRGFPLISLCWHPRHCSSYLLGVLLSCRLYHRTPWLLATSSRWRNWHHCWAVPQYIPTRGIAPAKLGCHWRPSKPRKTIWWKAAWVLGTLIMPIRYQVQLPFPGSANKRNHYALAYVSSSLVAWSHFNSPLHQISHTGHCAPLTIQEVLGVIIRCLQKTRSERDGGAFEIYNISAPMTGTRVLREMTPAWLLLTKHHWFRRSLQCRNVRTSANVQVYFPSTQQPTNKAMNLDVGQDAMVGEVIGYACYYQWEEGS